jgi:hypothetical protein
MGCENCNELDSCASWKIRLTEASNYCEDFISLDCLDYGYSEGEVIWYEMSYYQYDEDSWNYGEIDEYSCYLEKLFMEEYTEDK